jgi:hypothetical protein
LNGTKHKFLISSTHRKRREMREIDGRKRRKIKSNRSNGITADGPISSVVMAGVVETSKKYTLLDLGNSIKESFLNYVYSLYIQSLE